MEDILRYLFPFADINLKQSLLLVNKELSKLRFKDFIEDDISNYIFKHKGYINIELYNILQKTSNQFNIYYTLDDFYHIIIYDKKLDTVNLTGCINLTSITLVMCNLISINLKGLINLQELDLSQNKLRVLKIYSNKLQSLDLSFNQLKDLDLGEQLDLKYFCLSDNYFEHLDFTYLPNLENLDLQNNSLYEITNLKGSYLKIINISNNELYYLNCATFNELKNLVITNNYIQTLDIQSKFITHIYARRNELFSINIENTINLKHLMLESNNIEYFDIPKCHKLKYLNLFGNPMCEEELNRLYNELGEILKI